VSRDPRIDAYIADAQPFARPILTHLRTLMHQAFPEVEETIKWGFPHYVYKGKILGGTAAFNAHASLHLWRLGAAAPVKEVDGLGQFGRLTSITDLPDETAIVTCIREAAASIDAPSAPVRKAAPRPPPAVPEALAAALEQAPDARATFERFSPTQRRDYCEWIEEAKRPATQAARIAQAIEWLGEGKPRHWKYRSA
jgi:hypothetical protein